MNDVSKKAGEYLDSAVNLLSELISYKSVMGEPEDNAPYGRECADVLEFAYDTLEKDGFHVRNFGNHAVTASFVTLMLCPLRGRLGLPIRSRLR